ncbi:MAG: hypothetical protein RLZZ46_659 [Bacteroidota bacterium]
MRQIIFNMKKSFLLPAALFFATGVALTSCSDDEAPVLTLTGEKEVTFDLGEAKDPGATATDNKDDEITPTSNWATAVKINEVNTYTVEYVAEDEAGNSTKDTRTVKVKADKLGGTYTATDVVSGASDPSFNGTYNYNMTVSASSDTYNKLILSNLGGFSSTFTATVTGTSVTIASQSIPGTSESISGTGQYDGTAKKLTSITYTAGAFGSGTISLSKL